MTERPSTWTATVSVRADDPKVLDWLERALRPEADREVPRARAAVARPDQDTLELTVSSHDSGAMRAALNTYLGWVHLSLATARTADRPM